MTSRHQPMSEGGGSAETLRLEPLSPASPARLLAGPADLAGHLDFHGPLAGHDGAVMLAAVERSGLTGRGGAAFPTGRKMRAVAENAARSRRSGRKRAPVVVANGSEGEPASGKDRTLLARAPHLILDGIAAAARVVGADQAYLCLHDDDHAGIRAAQNALAERRAQGVDTIEVSITAVPARYVASEESALVNLLDGGPALPRFTPPRPFERGVGGSPTLIDNVETLAHVALIARHGPTWFRGAGTGDAPGTAVVTISGAVARPGVYEIPLGITGTELLARAGGAAEPLQAVLTGGYFGTWIPDDRLAATRITPHDLTRAGAAMGAGVFVALPRAACGIAETARVARYLADQSAQQCGPCLNGLPALAAALEALAAQGDRRAPDYIATLAPFVARRGACRLPDGATRLIATALATFAEDVRAHTRRGPCPATRRAPILPVPPRTALAEVHR